MRNVRIRLLALALLYVAVASAQSPCAEFETHPERSAGLYHSYEYRPDGEVARPEGYVPFYISHYGRHGSRWHISEDIYTEPLELLRKADLAQALTPKGREVLARMETVAADADGRLGDLSPRGVREQRGIAERMYRAYPEVFSPGNGREAVVESRSTLVPRVILSMAAFNERLKELDPSIRTSRESSRRYLPYMDNYEGRHAQGEAARAMSDSLRRAWIAPDRFLGTLFTDPVYGGAGVSDRQMTMYRFFLVASIMQDVDYLGISFYDLFTPEELCMLWEYENANRYLTMGPSKRFGEKIVADARPLLRNIVETADRVVEGESDLSASLRFGHDVNMIPLLALMGVEGASARVEAPREIAGAWNASQVSPMATNVQFIFFRNPATGEVRVRVMHNERDARLPLAGGPFYPWDALRSYLEAQYE